MAKKRRPRTTMHKMLAQLPQHPAAHAHPHPQIWLLFICIRQCLFLLLKAMLTRAKQMLEEGSIGSKELEHHILEHLKVSLWLASPCHSGNKLNQRQAAWCISFYHIHFQVCATKDASQQFQPACKRAWFVSRGWGPRHTKLLGLKPSQPSSQPPFLCRPLTIPAAKSSKKKHKQWLRYLQSYSLGLWTSMWVCRQGCVQYWTYTNRMLKQ